MLINEKGDLLKSDCTVIMHQANCMSTMGAGIAKEIARKYPKAAQVDKEYPRKPEDKLGTCSFAVTNDKTIVNLYGQLHYGKGVQTNYEMLKKALECFFDYTKNIDPKESNINLNKIGVPYKMGAGLAGGNWNKIKNILKQISEEYNIDIYIYKL